MEGAEGSFERVTGSFSLHLIDRFPDEESSAAPRRV
jgi:hypothetical protein